MQGTKGGSRGEAEYNKTAAQAVASSLWEKQSVDIAVLKKELKNRRLIRFQAFFLSICVIAHSVFFWVVFFPIFVRILFVLFCFAIYFISLRIYYEDRAPVHKLMLEVIKSLEECKSVDSESNTK